MSKAPYHTQRAHELGDRLWAIARSYQDGRRNETMLTRDEIAILKEASSALHANAGDPIPWSPSSDIGSPSSSPSTPPPLELVAEDETPPAPAPRPDWKELYRKSRDRMALGVQFDPPVPLEKVLEALSPAYAMAAIGARMASAGVPPSARNWAPDWSHIAGPLRDAPAGTACLAAWPHKIKWTVGYLGEAATGFPVPEGMELAWIDTTALEEACCVRLSHVAIERKGRAVGLMLRGAAAGCDPRAGQELDLELVARFRAKPKAPLSALRLLTDDELEQATEGEDDDAG